MTKPITPEEIGTAKAEHIPPEVFAAFNAEIATQYINGTATVRQDDVIKRILETTTLERGDIFHKGYLNVEDAYRAAGWIVSYDKPDYNESYDATFEFKHPKST